MNYISKYKSPIGLLIIESDGTNLTAIWIEGHKTFALFSKVTDQENELPIFIETKKWLDIYFSGQAPPFTPPIMPNGSKFRQTVWQMLLEIPYGELTSYGHIAKAIAKQMGVEKMSAQAVGGAVGANPISIIIPCHRVVGANGNLTGYASGLGAKIKLLEIENPNPNLNNSNI